MNGEAGGERGCLSTDTSLTRHGSSIVTGLSQSSSQSSSQPSSQPSSQSSSQSSTHRPSHCSSQPSSHPSCYPSSQSSSQFSSHDRDESSELAYAHRLLQEKDLYIHHLLTLLNQATVVNTSSIDPPSFSPLPSTSRNEDTVLDANTAQTLPVLPFPAISDSNHSISGSGSSSDDVIDTASPSNISQISMPFIDHPLPLSSSLDAESLKMSNSARLAWSSDIFNETNKRSCVVIPTGGIDWTPSVASDPSIPSHRWLQDDDLHKRWQRGTLHESPRPLPLLIEEVDHLVMIIHGIGKHDEQGMASYLQSIEEMTMEMKSHHFTQKRMSVNALHREHGLDDQTTLITLPGIPRLREVVNGAAVDVFCYLLPRFQRSILNTIADKANEAYACFLEKHPTFEGDVSLLGHSLGGVIAYDLLYHQSHDCTYETSRSSIGVSSSTSTSSPLTTSSSGMASLPMNRSPSLPPLPSSHPDRTCPNGLQHLTFKIQHLFMAGSPVGAFLMLRGAVLSSTSPLAPTRCYNIFHPYDPVAYRMEPLIDRRYAALKVVQIPYHQGLKRFYGTLRDVRDAAEKKVESFISLADIISRGGLDSGLSLIRQALASAVGDDRTLRLTDGIDAIPGLNSPVEQGTRDGTETVTETVTEAVTETVTEILVETDDVPSVSRLQSSLATTPTTILQPSTSTIDIMTTASTAVRTVPHLSITPISTINTSPVENQPTTIPPSSLRSTSMPTSQVDGQPPLSSIPLTTSDRDINRGFWCTHCCKQVSVLLSVCRRCCRCGVKYCDVCSVITLVEIVDINTPQPILVCKNCYVMDSDVNSVFPPPNSPRLDYAIQETGFESQYEYLMPLKAHRRYG